MNKINEKRISVCATCLSLLKKQKSYFPVTEDIIEILRCLLHGFNFDKFFKLKPPDKQLKLCEKCHNTIRDMISFKVCVLNSFKEFMKYWYSDKKKITTYTLNAPSSSLAATGNLGHVMEINPLQLNYTEPDPLEIKSETENIENIDIKDERDIIDVNNETYNLNENHNVINEPESDTLLIKFEQEQAVEKNQISNESIYSNVTPVFHSDVGHKNNFLINEATVSNVSKQSSYRNIAPKPHNLKHTNNFITNNINVGNDNFYSAGTNKDDLEAVIHGNLLIKNVSANLTNNTLAHTNANTNISVTNISHTNNTAITNTNYLDNIIFEANNDNLFKRISVDDGKDVAKSSAKKLKIIKIDYQGNIENVGEAMISPFAESAQVIPTAQQPPVFPNTFAAASSVPDTNITQTVNDEGGIPECNTSERELEEEIQQNKSPKTVEGSRKVRKKWYIKIVTREEILKKMEERRNDPKFVNSPYKCESCVRVYPTQSLAETHKKNIHVEDSEFTCFACHSAFKTLTSMNSHYYEHLEDISRYYCVTCEFETKHVELMQDHICPNAGRKPLPPKDPKTMKISAWKSLYYCPKCELVTTNNYGIVHHYEVVHQEHERLKCEVCGKFSKNKYMLKNHMNFMHFGKPKPGKQEPTYCQTCDTWFTNKYTYLNHVQSKHTPGRRIFACDECEKQFQRAIDLKYHKDFHAASKAGVKNFKCNMCDKAYYTKRVLRRHVQSSHEKPATRNHICEVCGKGFFTSIMLKGHSAMHSDERPLKCTFCEDTFKYSGALYTHIKLKHKKKKNGEELRNEAKPKETRKGKGQTKNKSKRRKKEESSSSSAEGELSDFRGSLI